MGEAPDLLLRASAWRWLDSGSRTRRRSSGTSGPVRTHTHTLPSGGPPEAASASRKPVRTSTAALAVEQFKLAGGGPRAESGESAERAERWSVVQRRPPRSEADIGEGIAEVQLTEWFVKEGDMAPRPLDTAIAARST